MRMSSADIDHVSPIEARYWNETREVERAPRRYGDVTLQDTI